MEHSIRRIDYVLSDLPELQFLTEGDVKETLSHLLSFGRTAATLSDDVAEVGDYVVGGEELDAAASPDRLKWVGALMTSTKETAREQLVPVIRDLQSALQRGDFALVAHAFATQVDVARVAPELLVAVLRASFVSRSHIDGWATFLKKVRDQFEIQGLPAETLLQGLGR